MRSWVPWMLVASVVGAGPSCGDGGSSVGGDADSLGGDDATSTADADARDAASDRDGEEARDADGDGAAEPGPLTFIVAERSTSTERLCDIDGDGSLDNAIADLGPADAAIFAGFVTTLLQSPLEYEVSPTRDLLHFPWVDDPSTPDDPSTTLIFCAAWDEDDPPDTTDDFSGEEVFTTNFESMDECGEPKNVTENVAIEEGRFVVEAFPLTLEIGLVAYDFGEGRISGTFERAEGGLELSTTLCGAWTVGLLGTVLIPTDMAPMRDGVTLLEFLVGGGALVGVPSLPGLELDIDLDGDGLERLELDGDGRLARCIDGDATVIEGSDCFSDERMADALSTLYHLRAVPAVFSGLPRGWETYVAATCEDPPAESAWAPR